MTSMRVIGLSVLLATGLVGCRTSIRTSDAPVSRAAKVARARAAARPAPAPVPLVRAATPSRASGAVAAPAAVPARESASSTPVSSSPAPSPAVSSPEGECEECVGGVCRVPGALAPTK